MRVSCECSSGLGIPSFLMVEAALARNLPRKVKSLVAIAMLISMPLVGIMNIDDPEKGFESLQNGEMPSQGNSSDIWVDGGQPWPQFGRTASRIAEPPAHGADGGAGYDEPQNSSSYMSIVKPSLNWAYGSYSIGTDSLATPIADLSGSIEVGPGAQERCGGSSLFSVLVQTQDVSGSDHSMLRLIEGEDSELAWQVDLGATEKVKSAPVIIDIDQDGKTEIVVAYDAGGSLNVDVWSPRLTCSVTGWSYTGHSDEKLWNWVDESLMISSDEGPYTSGIFGGHKPTTQPLLADIDLDGDAELVISVLDEISENPVVLALPLQTNGTPNEIWQVTLNKGSHPSDPAFAQTDENTGYVVLTTIEATNGAMWVWKIDSSSGSSVWQGGLSLNNLDGDTNAPHIRLPGPVIANLDSDPDPEIIITIPTDADGSNAVDGAEFRGIELSDGSEIWDFEASNGFADAPPVAIDTDGDGEHDRVCWVTWWQTTTDRHGAAGCHDVGGAVPNQEWVQDLEQSSGNPNDEIAVSAPTWMDIDSEDEPELLVAYGRSLWAFDGSSGSPAGVNSEWSDDFELDHRTWSSPSLADIDGDATLDIIIGSMALSMAMADVRPITDNRGIEFNPSSPDPGEQVTVTAYLENAGTSRTNEILDVELFANGEKIGGTGISSLDPVEPSGSGSFSSFSVEWSGGLGDHVFELILDPYRNISQTRYDNDHQTHTLSIVPPYNASFEIPTEPLRIDPGDSNYASIGIRSTGRLAGSWTLNVDDSYLPEGWTWGDQTPGGISNVQIGSGELWSPVLRVYAPSSALGSDTGYLGLTLTHDGGESQVSANLPIEANRTRGLSIRGPDGTSQSTGYGLISGEAMAWLLIENVGNAAEEQIAVSWDSTEWGSDLRIFDSEGEEIPALSLGPGEEKEVTARIQVPSGANLGENVSTPLSMCVGMGDDQECSDVELNFVASGSVVQPSHIRSVPTDGLSWSIHVDLPVDSGILNWSLTESGMMMQGWSWEGTDQVSVLGDLVSISGTPGSRVSGNLNLNLPMDTRPAFHLFEDGADSEFFFPLSMSLEVMQIHRAALEVNSPTNQPYIVNVDEESLVVLRLENPGNGDDSYSLSYEVITDDNITSDLGIEVHFSSNPVILGAGSLRTIPLGVTLPEETPARVPIRVLFTMTSEGNRSVRDIVEVIFEVRQDHRWQIDSRFGDREINGSTYLVEPGGSVEFFVNATNLGNLMDDLTLDVDIELNLEGSDESREWVANGSSAEGIGVNDSVLLSISAFTPKDAWNGSIMTVSVTAMARDTYVAEFSFDLEITHVPGWGVSSSMADLEIDPEGSEVSLEILQRGNSPTIPYVSVYVTGQKGWDINQSNQLGEVQPGQSISLNLDITPPETATHGLSVELHVRVREGDSSGLTEITLPLRVSIVQDFTMVGMEPWVISEYGGFPNVLLENTGNAPNTIILQVLGLPPGWGVRGDSQAVLGVGEERGVPIEVIPPSDWEGEEPTIRIQAEDSNGNLEEIILSTYSSEYSWGSSPYIFVESGDDALIDIHGTDSTSSVVDTFNGQLVWTESGWLLPSSTSFSGEISVDSVSTLRYNMSVRETASRSLVCSILGSLETLVGTCSISNGSYDFTYQALLISDDGDVLDALFGVILENSTGMINLSAEDWNPVPGKRSLMIRVLDNKGTLVPGGSSERSFDIRRSDWNVGIGDLELIGEGSNQRINIPTKRLNENLLEDADCIITMRAGSHYSEHLVDMTQAFVPAPKFERPDVEDETELIVTIGCSFPWDQDADPSDDEAVLVLSGRNSVEENIDRVGTGLLSAILVVGLYLGVAWIVRNYKERELMMEIAQSAIDEKISKIVETPTNKEDIVSPDTSENEEDDELEVIEDTPEDENSDIDEYEKRLRRLLDR